MKYWACPLCGWRVSDLAYLSITIDPVCSGCGVTKFSEFRFVEEEDLEL